MSDGDVSDDALMTKHETARRLHISTRSLERLVAQRAIGFCRVGALLRFRPADVDAFVSRSYQAPVERTRRAS